MKTFLTVSAALTVLILSSAMTADPAKESSVFVSLDHGVTWNRGDRGFPDNDGVNALILHDNRVFAGTDSHGIYAMDKNGWYDQSHGLPKKSRVISLLSYNQLLFAGLYNGGLFYSADDGSTWRAVEQRPAANVRALAGHNGTLYAGTDDGIYKVDIRLGTWEQLLSGRQINGFTFNDKYIYASTNLGVVRSNNGSAWESIYERGAINKVAVNKSEILLMDYSGNVYRGEEMHPYFVKMDLFLPHTYLQLTPSSPRIMGGEWSELSFMKYGYRRGLPDIPLSILLQTPFGLFAVRSLSSGC
jgi:hypothetical protein